MSQQTITVHVWEEADGWHWDGWPAFARWHNARLISFPTAGRARMSAHSTINPPRYGKVYRIEVFDGEPPEREPDVLDATPLQPIHVSWDDIPTGPTNEDDAAILDVMASVLSYGPPPSKAQALEALQTAYELGQHAKA